MPSFMGGNPEEAGLMGEAPDRRRRRKLAAIRSQGIQVTDEEAADDEFLERKYRVAMQTQRAGGTTRPIPS